LVLKFQQDCQSSFSYLGLELFAFCAALLLFLGILVARHIVNINDNKVLIDKVGGNWSEAITNIITERCKVSSNLFMVIYYFDDNTMDKRYSYY